MYFIISINAIVLNIFVQAVQNSKHKPIVQSKTNIKYPVHYIYELCTLCVMIQVYGTRRMKVIKYSSPTFLNITLVGCTVMYSEVVHFIFKVIMFYVQNYTTMLFLIMYRRQVVQGVTECTLNYGELPTGNFLLRYSIKNNAVFYLQSNTILYLDLYHFIFRLILVYLQSNTVLDLELYHFICIVIPFYIQSNTIIYIYVQ